MLLKHGPAAGFGVAGPGVTRELNRVRQELDASLKR